MKFGDKEIREVDCTHLGNGETVNACCEIRLVQSPEWVTLPVTVSMASMPVSDRIGLTIEALLDEHEKDAVATAVSMFPGWKTDQFDAAVEYAVDYCERAHDPRSMRWEDALGDVHDSIFLEMNFKRARR